MKKRILSDFVRKKKGIPFLKGKVASLNMVDTVMHLMYTRCDDRCMMGGQGGWGQGGGNLPVAASGAKQSTIPPKCTGNTWLQSVSQNSLVSGWVNVLTLVWLYGVSSISAMPLVKIPTLLQIDIICIAYWAIKLSSFLTTTKVIDAYTQFYAVVASTKGPYCDCTSA